MDQPGTDEVRSPGTTPLWMSHHWPEHHDRCVRVAGRVVCRRCLVLYPAVLVAATAIWVLDPPVAILVAAMWVLPAPMTVEWVLEHAGMLQHHPRRLVALTLLAAPALGAAMVVHLGQPFTPIVWAPIGFWVTVCVAASVTAAARGPDGSDDWEARHEAAEEDRLRRLMQQAGTSRRVPSPDARRNADPSRRASREDRWVCSTEPTTHSAEQRSADSSPQR